MLAMPLSESSLPLPLVSSKTLPEIDESVWTDPLTMLNWKGFGWNDGVVLDASCPTMVPLASLVTVNRAMVNVPVPSSGGREPHETFVSCALKTPPLPIVG